MKIKVWDFDWKNKRFWYSLNKLKGLGPATIFPFEIVVLNKGVMIFLFI